MMRASLRLTQTSKTRKTFFTVNSLSKRSYRTNNSSTFRNVVKPNFNSSSAFLFLGLGIAAGALFNSQQSSGEEKEEKEENEEELQNKVEEVKEEEEEVKLVEEVREKKTEEEFNFENKFGNDKENVPENISVKYLLIGGGVATYSAIKAIREKDPDGQILVISDEEYLPYSRPALSKEVWDSESENTAQTYKYLNFTGNSASLFFKDESFYEDKLTNIVFLHNTTVIDMNPTRKIVAINNKAQSIIKFDKCLIASGSRAAPIPKDISISPSARSKITTFRDLNNFKVVDEVTRTQNEDGSPKHIVVVGGDNMGCELAGNLAERGKRLGYTVHNIIPNDGVLRDLLPKYLSDFASEKLKESGVQLHTNAKINSITTNDAGKLVIHLDNHSTPLEADFAVFSTGTVPNDNLAQFSFEIDEKNGGILCSPELQARSNIFVAGDVLSYYDVYLNMRRRVETFDHALESGKLSGINMASNAPPQPYLHIPVFWTEVGRALEIQGLGICDSSLRTVSYWVRPPNYDIDDIEYENDYRKGVVYYLSPEDRVVGILLCGMSDTLSYKLYNARRVLRFPPRVKSLEDIQKLVQIEEWPGVFNSDV